MKATFPTGKCKEWGRKNLKSLPAPQFSNTALTGLGKAQEVRSWRVVTGRPPLFYHRPSTCLLLGLIISFSPTACGWVVRPLPSADGQSRRSWTIVGGLDKLSMRIIRLMWDRRYYQECTMSKIVRRLNRCKMIIHIRQLNHQPSWSRRSFFFSRGPIAIVTVKLKPLSFYLLLNRDTFSRPGSSISKISNGDWYYSELWDNDQFGGQLDRSLAA